MLATVFVGGFQVQELLAQIVDIGLQTSCFRGQPLVNFAGRAEDKPEVPMGY